MDRFEFERTCVSRRILKFLMWPAVLLSVTLLASADPASLPSSEDILALLKASGTEDVAQVGPAAAEQLIAAYHRGNPGLSDRADEVIRDVVVTYVRQAAERDRVVERLVPIYAKYLTRSDVQQLTEFYRSPLGRKLVNVLPGISTESAEVGHQWMTSILPGLQAQLHDRLKSEKLVQ